MMQLQRPIYLDFAADAPQRAVGMGLAGLGEAVTRCGWITPFVLGGVAMYALPPFLGGFLSGAREAIDERKR